jgi:hypothetical protein
MKKNILKGIILLSLSLTTFLLSGCVGPLYSKIHVTLKNNSSTETHLWKYGENIDPANKLAPGESRTTEVTWIQDDGAAIVKLIDVTVYACRNGVTLTSKTFGVKVQETNTLNVEYNGSDLISTQ